MKSLSRNQVNWITVAIFSALFALPLLLPWAVQQLATSWLHENGAPQATIEDVDINLFTGKVAIEGLSAGEGFSWQKLSIRINWLPLFEKKLHIRSLAFTDADIRAEQTGGVLKVGDVLIPASDGGSENRVSSDQWVISLGHLFMQNITMRLKTDDADILGRVALGSIRGQALADGLQIDCSINLDKVSGHSGASRLVLDELYWQGQLQVPSLAAIADATLVQGLLALEALQLIPEGQPEVSLETLRVAGIRVPDGQHLVVQEVSANRLSIDQRSAEAAVPELISIGGITAGDIKVDLMEKGGLEALNVSQLGLNAVQVSHRDVAIAKVGTLALSALKIDDQLLPSIGSLNLTNILLPEDKQAALGRIAGLEVRRASMTQANQLNVAEITVDGLDLTLQKKKKGMAVVDGVMAMGRGSSGTTGKAAAGKKSDPFTLKVEKILLPRGSRIAFRDETVSPVFRAELKTGHLAIEQLDTSGERSGTVDSSLIINRDGAVAVKGEFRLKPGKPSVAADVGLSRLDVSTLSGYLEQGFGHAVKTGQLDMKSTLNIANGDIKATNDLTIRRLTVQKSEYQGSAEAKLGMPLNTALDMLRDDLGDIELKVPLSGRLDDPNVNINDAINQALVSAMSSAALSYASMFLQPYGSILPVLSYASDLIKTLGKPRLTPVSFTPRSHALNKDAEEYIAKLAGMLGTKPFRLQLCGVAHRSEADALGGKGAELDEKLLEIASERAHEVKAGIMAHGIESERLFNCRPIIDEKSKEGGRVELLLD